jgi:hypothetical protein
MAIQQQTSAAEQFISELYQDPEMQTVLLTIPEVFIEQAREGYDSFFIDTELMSRSQYTRETGECDLFRVVLEDPILYANGAVAVKLRLNGIIDADGNMVPHKAGATLQPGQSRLSGFRSTPVVFDNNSVADGVITAQDLEVLQAYAEMWEQEVEDFGESTMYTTEKANKRLWLVATNADGLVTFDMTLRLNPKTKKPVIGIQNVLWDNCAFIGVGTGAAMQQPAGKAAAPAVRKPSVKLPKLDRGSGSVPGITRRRNRR